MKILYVEDNKVNLMLVERVARMDGHSVINRTTGETTIEEFDDIAPDIILMDIQLEGAMTGLDAVKILRERGVNIPIIAVTAYAMKGDREKALNAGCDEYIPKPIPVKMLLELLQKYGSQPITASKPAPEAAPPVAEDTTATDTTQSDDNRTSSTETAATDDDAETVATDNDTESDSPDTPAAETAATDDDAETDSPDTPAAETAATDDDAETDSPDTPAAETVATEDDTESDNTETSPKPTPEPSEAIGYQQPKTDPNSNGKT